MDRAVITRSEARQLGLSQYFTGLPCPKGHICNKNVSNRNCLLCRLDQTKRNRLIGGSGHSRRMRNNKLRRAKIRGGSGGVYTLTDIDDIMFEQNNECLCGVSLYLGYHIDHKTPLSRGGSSWPSNLQLLCAPCNLEKGAKTMEEWSGRKAA